MSHDLSLELFIPSHWIKIDSLMIIERILKPDFPLSKHYHTFCSPDFIIVWYHNPETCKYYDDSMVACYDKINKWAYLDPTGNFALNFQEFHKKKRK